jgi:hypothetical protein
VLKPVLREPVDLTFRVTGEPMLIYIGTDGQSYRIDCGEVPKDQRECAIYDAFHRLGTVAKTSTGKLVP